MSSTTARDDSGRVEQCRQVSDEDRDGLVLGLMLGESSSYPWTREELARTIGDHIGAFDAVGRLEAAGLLHRLGEFVFPTVAARRADEIEL